MMTKNITHINIPDDVSFIIKNLEKNGFEAYAVGGCVRDSLIGRAPGDWDITTSAFPAEIKETFRRTVDTGIEHGTVTVLLGDSSYEVTTYRIDGAYRDNRHPEHVSFTDSVREDLRRRDFTINAMAYNEQTGILDLFDGREDLEKGVIRCVGAADERFDEDALRILRAVRFAAQLDFEIEEETAAAITRHAENLAAVSKERILTEISKLICSAHIEKIKDIFELGLAPYITECFGEINLKQLNELAEANRNSASDDAFNLYVSVPISLRFIRFAFLCEGMEKEHVRRLLKGLKPDNDTLNHTVFLVDNLFKPLPSDRYELKKLMSGIDPELFYCLLRLKEASADTSMYKNKCARNMQIIQKQTAGEGDKEDMTGQQTAADEPENLPKVRAVYEDILANKEPVYLKELALTGSDLIKLGVKPGPGLGTMLKELLDFVHKEPEKNNRDELTKYISEII